MDNLEEIKFDSLKLGIFNNLPAVKHNGAWYYWKIDRLGVEYLEKAEAPNKGHISYRIAKHRFYS